MIEIELALAWIVQRLLSDPGPGGAGALATGGIHSPAAPVDAAYPLVAVRHLGSSYTNALGGRRIVLNGLFGVTAWTRGASTDPILPLAARIDERFQFTPDALAAASEVTIFPGEAGELRGVVLSCVAETPLSPDDERDGVRFRGRGVALRIQIQKG